MLCALHVDQFDKKIKILPIKKMERASEKKYRYYAVCGPLWKLPPPPLDMTGMPEPPEKPDILKRISPLTGLLQPSTPNQKLVFTVTNSMAFGFLAGLTNSWFHDHLKIPKITVKQSLLLHYKVNSIY